MMMLKSAPRRGRARSAQRLELPVVDPHRAVSRRLPHITPIEKRGQFLRPSPMADLLEDDILSVNHVSGCAMQCTFCYARGYPGFAGDAELQLYINAADGIRRELRERRGPPRAVYLCPSTDPFPPFSEIQAETVRIIDVLAEFKVESWLMTRGHVRPGALQRLRRHRDLIQITFALTTLDRNLRRVLEPLAAPTRLRLRQLRELRDLGFAVQASIEPLIRGLTDTHDNLAPLLDELAKAGINRVSTAYLYVRPGIQQNLERELEPLGLAKPILEPYQQGPILPMGRIAAARHLPRAERQRGYARLMALAAERGIAVNVCGLTNPDFSQPRAALPQPSRPLRQLDFGY